MRNLFTFLGIVGFVTIGCGGDAITIDGGSDGSGMDGAKADGSGGDSGGTDSGGMDSGGMDTGANDSGGPMDGGVQCTSPSMCGMGKPICCGTVTPGMGQFPQCFQNGTFSTMCASTCTSTMFSQQCTPATRRVCDQGTNCSEAAYPNCCTLMNNVYICITDQEKAFTMPMCK